MSTEDDVRAKFGIIWPAHVSSLTEFLLACRDSFDGDLDMFLVMCVIGDRTFSARHVDPKMSYDVFRGRPPAIVSEDINIRSIADFSGIPRETVRRKISLLQKKGWIERSSNGSIVATTSAKQDLEPLTLSSIKYIARMKAILGHI